MSVTKVTERIGRDLYRTTWVQSSWYVLDHTEGFARGHGGDLAVVALCNDSPQQKGDWQEQANHNGSQSELMDGKLARQSGCSDDGRRLFS